MTAILAPTLSKKFILFSGRISVSVLTRLIRLKSGGNVLAKQARDFVRELHSQASKIDLINCKRGKYFRLVCDVLIDGNDLGKILIEKVHAREYDGGKRESWCD